MKFKFFLKVNSYPFARNFKNQGAQGENLKMANILSEKVLQNIAKNKDKLDEFIKKFPSEESYIKYIYANKYGLDINKIDKIDYSKLNDRDLISYGDKLFKDAFENVIKDEFSVNPKDSKIDQKFNQNHPKNRSNVNNNSDFKGEELIDIDKTTSYENDKSEKNLQELMEEMEKNPFLKKSGENNFEEKDINKIQSNIFKKEKFSKEKIRNEDIGKKNKPKSKFLKKDEYDNIKF